ncbi:hypothetical protein LC653_12635 [Nostoc sp. CHAB 5784]|uniref:hypothetical protein n=1 Tax=Nostoc mirabile TaxID=2907820 RepID=UPI001E4339BC|nr:hypothetical protein [Nostoc mirabile]MCC5664743.1 hypothetical protein [Nostoc mirabile CHAB5784]
MKFPTATANFSTSFHTATTVAEWHKIREWGVGSGEWGDEGAGGAGGERITNNLLPTPYSLLPTPY